MARKPIQNYPRDGRARVAPNNVALKTGVPAGVNNVDADILDGAADLSHTLLENLEPNNLGPGSTAQSGAAKVAKTFVTGGANENSTEVS